MHNLTKRHLRQTWPQLAVLGLVAACGAKSGSSDMRTGVVTPEAANATGGVDPHASVVPMPGANRNLVFDGTQVTGEDPTAFNCAAKKSPTEFMTTVALDLFRRGPSAAELTMAKDPAFDYAKTADWALAQPDFLTSGVAYFASNLLRINENLLPMTNTAAEAALDGDLKQEAVILMQRSIAAGKPWSDVFTTTEYPCSALTSPLYNIPSDVSVSGFSTCKIDKADQQRVGILGMVSVLRAYSSAFYLNNNNYHRDALTVYLAWGLELAAKTNGPTGGNAKPDPLPQCMPMDDNRVSAAGAPFGTIAIPESGAVCAGCHSHFQGPMSAGFLDFGPDGSELQLSDIAKLQPTETVGIDNVTLKNILINDGSSCWASTGLGDAAQNYQGLPGLARLIASSPMLGKALAIQIQQNFFNTSTKVPATQAILESYNAPNNGTFTSAMKGYLTSDVYKCSMPAAPPTAHGSGTGTGG